MIQPQQIVIKAAESQYWWVPIAVALIGFTGLAFKKWFEWWWGKQKRGD